MKRKKWAVTLACIALICVTGMGVALAVGTQGSQSDPLITLSYLNDVAFPQWMQTVDEKIDAKAEELTRQMGENGKAVFETLEVPAGQTVTLFAGTQVILRGGEASNNDALTDLTDASVLWSGMVANHLYIATADGQVLTVTSDAVFLIQGRYTVAE